MHILFSILAFTIIIAVKPIIVHAEETVSSETNQNTRTSAPFSSYPQSRDTYSQPNFFDNILNEVDYQHKSLSEQLVEFTEQIDTFFISDDQERRINYSHIQLGYRYTRYQDDPSLMDPVFQARLHLPRTQNRLTVEVSNNNPFDPINDIATNTSSDTNPADQTDQTLNIGLGYARAITDLLDFKVTGGTRLAGDRMKVFINLQVYRKFFFYKWSLHLSEDLYRDNVIFNRATAQMLFERSIGDDRLFRSITKNITYSDLGYAQNHQTFYVLDQLSTRDAIIYQVGSMWEKQFGLLDYELENYYTMVRYSRKIYRDWLFMELSPQVQYLRTENFHPKPLISLQVTAFFGNNQ